jgi:hypothetical protein
LVVSEETGVITLARKGKLTRNIHKRVSAKKASDQHDGRVCTYRREVLGASR